MVECVGTRRIAPFERDYATIPMDLFLEEIDTSKRFGFNTTRSKCRGVVKDAKKWQDPKVWSRTSSSWEEFCHKHFDLEPEWFEALEIGERILEGNGTVSEAVELGQKVLAQHGAQPSNTNATQPEKHKAILDAKQANPDASARAIAREVGVSDHTVAKAVSAQNEGVNNTLELRTPKPKLQRGTTNRDYTIAKLRRDGHPELADKVEAKEMSARAARLELGWEREKVGVQWDKVEPDIPRVAHRIAELLSPSQLSLLAGYLAKEQGD